MTTDTKEPPQQAVDALLGRKQLAAALGLSPRGVDLLRSSGELPKPCLWIGKFPRWRTSAINAWIASKAEKEQQGG